MTVLINVPPAELNKILEELEKKEITVPRVTHWYYMGETVYKTGRVLSACGKLVHHEKDCSSAPTCKTCADAMKRYNEAEP